MALSGILIIKIIIISNKSTRIVKPALEKMKREKAWKKIDAQGVN